MTWDVLIINFTTIRSLLQLIFENVDVYFNFSETFETFLLYFLKYLKCNLKATIVVTIQLLVYKSIN